MAGLPTIFEVLRAKDRPFFGDQFEWAAIGLQLRASESIGEALPAENSPAHRPRGGNGIIGKSEAIAITDATSLSRNKDSRQGEERQNYWPAKNPKHAFVLVVVGSGQEYDTKLLATRRKESQGYKHAAESLT